MDRGGRGGDRGGGRGGRGGDRGGRGGDRGGRGGDRGGRGGGDRGGSAFVRPPAPDVNSIPSISVKTMPKQELGKGATMPLLFGGNRFAKTTDQPTTAAAAAAGAAFGGKGAKSAAKVERDEARLAEAAATRRAEAETARQQVQQAIENVTTLSGGAAANDAQEIYVNCFPINCDLKTSSFYQYQVSVEPEIHNRKKRKTYVERALTTVASKFQVPMPVQTNNLVFASAPIHNHKDKDTKEEKVELTTFEKKHTVTFRFTRTFENNSGLSTDAYGVLSTVLREAFDAAGMVKIGGKYFDVTEKFTKMMKVEPNGSPEAVNIASGLNITLYPTSRGLMLNVDLAMRVTRRDSVLTTIKACKAFADKTGLKYQDIVRNELTGAIAATTYSLNSRKQTLNIVEVRFDVNPNSVIPGDNYREKKLTFAQYMKEHHNLTVTDPTQPLLLFRSQREVDRDGKPLERWFIPEFCQLVGQSEKMRSNSALQQDLKRACLLTAQERFGYISAFMQKIHAAEGFQRTLGSWKMALDARITKVPMKHLRCPQLTLKTDDARRAWNCATGGRNAKAPSWSVGAWAVVYPNRLFKDQLDGMLGALNGDLRKMGVNLPAPQLWDYQSDRDPGRWGRNLAARLGELGEEVRFALIVLNDNNEDNYFLVKETSLKDWDVPSQCILLRNAQCPDPRKLGNITSRIAGQIVVKLGGALWATTQPAQGSAGGLVIGMSVTAAKGCSVLSLVGARAEDNMPIASYAGHFTGDAAKVIETGFNKILTTFKALTKSKPKTIFVFRPGMNEGDVPDIITKEVIPTQKICASEKVALVFINALKRCSIRFYPSPAGSLIDDYLTPTTGFTFFVVPQMVTQGCATAMKFSVLSNSAPKDITGSVIEEVAFNQCHMFYGWWGATREPAVVMFSERLAELHAKTKPQTKPMPYYEGVRVL